MTTVQLAAITAVVILFLVVILQISLAAGAPIGHLAWGGQSRVLPTNHRIGSAVAALLLAFAAWVISARADLFVGGLEPGTGRVISWIFAGLFALNTVGNLASRSRAERLVMAPLTLVLTVCFVVASFARQ